MMALFLTLVGLCSFPFITGEIRLKRQNSCRTPSGETGDCLSIRNCEPLLPLLRKANSDAEAANFLRRSQCGGYAEVCCPRNTSPRNTPVLDPPEAICGKNNVTGVRIVGGIPADLGGWPWIAVLGYRYNNRRETAWSCGGSLINKRYVLTAAHCINPPPPHQIGKLVTVRLGEHDLNSTSDGANPVDFGVEKTIVHEDYRSQSNDIALIRLDKDVVFTDKIKPICLPELPSMRYSNHEGKHPFVAGWGRTFLGGPSSHILLQVQLPVVDNENCNRAYARFGARITDRQICAGDRKGGKDSCQGDSGGPLMVPENGKYFQIGIVSFGYKCAEPGYPGVYSRVSSYLDWIKNNME